jgi:multidrug efflux system membrane fusion protein
VRLGPLSGGLRVVRDGMAANDWVVVKGLQLARPGQKVQTKREAIRVSQSADSAPRSDR